MVMVLYISSFFAPLLTQIAADIGFAIPEGPSRSPVFPVGNWIAWVLTTISQLIFGG